MFKDSKTAQAKNCLIGVGGSCVVQSSEFHNNSAGFFLREALSSHLGTADEILIILGWMWIKSLGCFLKVIQGNAFVFEFVE